MSAAEAKDKQQDSRVLGAVRVAMWVVLPLVAFVIQLRQANRQPGWAGYMRFMAAWQILGLGHRLYELWAAGRSKA
ncbi:hypothetical protein [Arthrobacter sp. C152]